MTSPNGFPTYTFQLAAPLDLVEGAERVVQHHNLRCPAGYELREVTLQLSPTLDHTVKSCVEMPLFVELTTWW